jgi:sugar/nucleoside kinase (ribokinase family)
MIAAVGDVVEDIVVRLSEPVNEATDTDSVVVRRRGGSAANVVSTVARAGHAARFIGQVGDDAHGAALLETLRFDGVDVVARLGGRTGTIVVLLDHLGERTMLTDRGACLALDHPDPAWLDGVTTLHVPLYSLVGEPLARTTTTLVEWAHRRDLLVSIDASSTSLIASAGRDAVIDLLRDLRPGVLFCNDAEADALGLGSSPGVVATPDVIATRVTVVKRGAAPALVRQPDGVVFDVPAMTIDVVRDTTGAGDAFAAGFLVALESGSSLAAATSSGHQRAARAIRTASGG